MYTAPAFLIFSITLLVSCSKQLVTSPSSVTHPVYWHYYWQHLFRHMSVVLCYLPILSTIVTSFHCLMFYNNRFCTCVINWMTYQNILEFCQCSLFGLVCNYFLPKVKSCFWIARSLTIVPLFSTLSTISTVREA